MTLRRIVPAEGMTLYNGEVLSKEVYLGTLDSPENWWEITDAEADAIRAEQEEPETDEATEADYQNALREMGVEV